MVVVLVFVSVLVGIAPLLLEGFVTVFAVVFKITAAIVSVAVAIAAFRGEDGYQVWVLPDDVGRPFRIDLYHDLRQTPNVLGDRSAV